MNASNSATAYICTACGTQHAASRTPPDACAICVDERQYVPPTGQGWTTLRELQRTRKNAFRRLEPGLFGIGTTPDFAIAQRALLVCTPHGNILWDCITLIDDATVEIVRALGGLRAIAISHPHYYASMVEWSHAFEAPVLLHAADRQWVMRPDPAITFWEGATHEVVPGARLVHCGGHFAGGTVLLWDDAADGRGALLSGDVVAVVSDLRYVSFMRSYPNYIPLPPSEVERIAAVVGALRFDRIYGAFWDRHIERDGYAAVQRSAARYIEWASGAGRDRSD
ncbi:MAG TPA: hypothetical protein VFJ02_01500 [Vicinamibacterales bacterium]|nr:hypothetical protein [Vicinamibacterales bacterium]